MPLARYAVLVAAVAGTATLAYAADHAISQKGRIFSPGTIRVKTGEALVFKNDDDVTHHVYSSTTGQEFTIETMEPGQSVPHTFAKPGRVDVRCGLHPGMRLMVTVE